MTPCELRDAINRLGLTQVGFAKRIQANPRTVRRWVSGDSPIPKHLELTIAGITGRSRPRE